MLAGLHASYSLASQEAHKPLSVKEVIDLLTNDVPPPRVAELTRQYGISFVLTATTEQTLRDAGATDDLIAALHKLAPKTMAPPAAQPPAKRESPGTTPSPPILLIESEPGDSQVYVDDEPMGTTSPEGRLKLSKLGAGEHRVRLGHPGYKDFEQTVTLTSGASTLAAKLESISAPQATPPSAASIPPAQQPAQASNSAPTAVLGMSIRPPAGGGQGALVVGLVPDSPAERAGIRPGYSILSVNGTPILTPQELVRSTVGRRPGDVVEVRFSNGSQISIARVALASPTIFENVPHFIVAHDHGPPAPNYCIGTMWILDGMIAFSAVKGVNASGDTGLKHNLEVPMSDIREIRRNGFYLAVYGAFHIRMNDGTVNNFVVEDERGAYRPPEQLINAVRRAMRRE